MGTNILIWVICLTSILGILIRPRKINEAWWAFGGAAILVASTLVPWRQAADAAASGTDVYFFLIGMMMLSELAREEGVFNWVAGIAGNLARHSAGRLFLLVYVSGTVVTVFLSNDATAIVLTPAVLTMAKELEADPVPHLLACALIANAASFVLPISNPANLVVFDARIPRLYNWLAAFWLPSLASVVLTYAGLRVLSRARLRKPIAAELGRRTLSANGRLALIALGIAALVLVTAATLGWPLGVLTLGAAIIATALVAIRDRAVMLNVLRGISWSIIPLVAGLFVMVQALQVAGLQQLALDGLHFVQAQSFTTGKLLTALVVGSCCNIFNNLPVGLISGNVLRAAAVKPWILNTTLIGVDLGPNLSVTGSLATILWLMALRREGVTITGWEFLKVGVVVMPLALIVCVMVMR